MSAAVLRIANYELDLPAREIRRDGEPVAVERRAFDLLAYLIQHRDRVVPKQELLRAVWPEQQVSDAALARAVMKARQAFAQTEVQELIRSVSRVGYRFVGLVQEAAVPPRRARDDAPLTIAVLPFENRTGDEHLQWTELGLMSLLSHALDQDTRLSPVSTEQIVSSLQSQDAGAQRGAGIGLRTGAQVLVQTRVVRRGEELGAELVVSGLGRDRHLSAEAADPPSLVGAIVPVLLDALFSSRQGTEAGVDMPTDPMAAEAFARGLQAMAQQKFSHAVDLFRMALSLAPGLARVELSLLNALAEVGDAAEAEALATRLAAKAEQSGDQLLAARVDLALARLNMTQRSIVAAGFRLTSAMKLGEGQLTLDEQGLALEYLCQLDLSKRDFDSAQHHAEQLEAHVKRSGNRLQLCDTFITRAIVAGCREDYEQAARLSEQGAREARAARANAALIANALNASHALIELDRLQEAAHFAEEALATATVTRNTVLIGHAARDLAVIYRLVRAPEAIERVLAALPEFGEATQVTRNLILCARGHYAACIGDHANSAERFGEAVAAMRQGRYALQEHETVPWLVAALVRAGRFDDAQAEIDAATQPAFAGNLRLQGHMLHARALLAHAKGDHASALALLRRLLSAGLSPLWRHWALLDTAWLLAEQGSAEEAQRLLAQVAPHHLAEQRIGCAVAARVACAAGRWEEAARLHGRYVAGLRNSRQADFFASLGVAAYAAGCGDTPLPHIPFLPSRL